MEGSMSRSLGALAPLLLLLVCAVATAAAPGGAPEFSGNAVRLAKGGDPVGYGRMLGLGQRCTVDAGLMGSAGGSAAARSLRSGKVRSLDEFAAGTNIGVRQANDLPAAAIDCAAIQRAFAELAGASEASLPSAAVSDPHVQLIARHTCPIDKESLAAVTMNSYLNEKNGIDRLQEGGEKNARIERLADSFISPHFISRYRILPGTIALDGYGSQPEVLICIRRKDRDQLITTAITSPGSGWTSVLQYRLADEGGRLYIQPVGPPRPNQVDRELHFEHEPTTWVDPLVEIDRYPRLAR
jgi:hypothetical protein